jgi:uncharacterized protein (DUF3084 family)
MSLLQKMGLMESDDPVASQEPVVRNMHPGVDVPPMPAYTPAANYTTTTLGPEDTERLKALEAQVYAIPSSYKTFQRVRETLGNTSDLKTVFNVLAAANPGVTAEKVLADIDAHLSIIASKKSEFDGQLGQARAARIDGPTQEMANLTAQNVAAQQQIAERTARISQLTQAAHDAEKAISDGSARFKLIEDQLSAPLLQAKQLLSSIS